MTEPALEVAGLRNAFGKKVVHDGISFVLEEGTITAVIGASGSGKTVLMRTIIGLHRPVAGSVKIFGEPANRQSSPPGVCFQNGALFSSMNVAENIMFPMQEQAGLSAELSEAIMFSKLELVGLSRDVAILYPAELSGGMRKRVALARALATEPRLLLLDEPTAGLDPVSALQVSELISELCRLLGLTVMVITHDLLAINKICKEVMILYNKRLLVKDTLDKVRQFDDPWVRAYFSTYEESMGPGKNSGPAKNSGHEKSLGR